METTSWVNGKYLLQIQIYYCDTNYSIHSTHSEIPFLIIIIIIIITIIII